MNQKPDIANIDPETWKFQVQINGYDENGYSRFAIRFLMTVLLNPEILEEFKKRPNRFQIWYIKNREKVLIKNRIWNKKHQAEMRKIREKWRTKHDEK